MPFPSSSITRPMSNRHSTWAQRKLVFPVSAQENRMAATLGKEIVNRLDQIDRHLTALVVPSDRLEERDSHWCDRFMPRAY